MPDQPARRVYLRMPDDWDEMTPEQQYQAAFEMALAMEEALGLESTDRTPHPELGFEFTASRLQHLNSEDTE